MPPGRGRELLFARLPFVPGGVVLADVDDDDPVIKRVEDIDGVKITLDGDDGGHSAWHVVPAHSIRAVMVCNMPVASPSGQRATRSPGTYCPPQ